MTTVYTAAVNDRFILKSSSIAGIKSSASRVANRAFHEEDRMVVTGRAGGELITKIIFRRHNTSRENRGEWVECMA